MRNKKPPFEITNQMIGYVAEIAELVGKLSAVSSLSANPTLRRSNRIRTIHGSLAIEQNTLSLEHANRRAERQACPGTAQGYCRSQKCL